MNKIDSRTDWLLDSCYSHCFVCRISLPTPLLDKTGRLERRALCFDIIDEYGDKQDNEERVCDKCWKSDLSNLKYGT